VTVLANVRESMANETFTTNCLPEGIFPTTVDSSLTRQIDTREKERGGELERDKCFYANRAADCLVAISWQPRPSPGRLHTPRVPPKSNKARFEMLWSAF